MLTHIRVFLPEVITVEDSDEGGGGTSRVGGVGSVRAPPAADRTEQRRTAENVAAAAVNEGEQEYVWLYVSHFLLFVFLSVLSRCLLLCHSVSPPLCFSFSVCIPIIHPRVLV